MKKKKLFELIKNNEISTRDALGMVLSNNADTGSPDGCLISVKQFDSVIDDIIQYYKNRDEEINNEPTKT